MGEDQPGNRERTIDGRHPQERAEFVLGRAHRGREGCGPAVSRCHRTHPQHGTAASFHARRAARHPEARRREGAQHRVRDRLSPPRGGEDRREPHLHDVQPLRGPHGLRGRGLERPRLLRSGGEAAEHGGAAARAVGAHHPDGAEPHRQPPALAGHARPRYRRHHPAVLHFPRPRRDPEDLREVLRRAAHHARLPHRRLPVRDLRRLRAGCEEVLRLRHARKWTNTRPC